MNRPDWSVVVVAVAVVLAALPVVVAGGMAPSGATGGTAAGAGTASQSAASGTPPGAQLAGVVGVQGEELEGELSERRFAHRLAAAGSDASRAGVVAEQVTAARERLSGLQERKAELAAARESGSMGRGEYRARMATLAARISTLERLTAASSQAATDLPDRALAEQGVNVAALDDLRSEAASLRGGEVAAIAREVAGPEVGTPVGVGPPADPGNGTPGGPDDEDDEPGNGDGPNGDGEPGNGGASGSNGAEDGRPGN